MGCYVGGAIFGTGIFYAINTTFYFCGKAVLNFGIAETIWGFTPFLTAILEFLIYKTKIQLHSVIGILCMLVAATSISLSQLFMHETDPSRVGEIPILIPILVSFSMPLVCSNFGMFTKYVYKRGINANDFTFGYLLMAKGFFFLASLVFYARNGIDWQMFVIGFFGSIIDGMGCFFANRAISTGSPVGPIFALVDTQILMVTIVSTIRMGVIPHWMQLSGLAVGTLGAVVLTKH